MNDSEKLAAIASIVKDIAPVVTIQVDATGVAPGPGVTPVIPPPANWWNPTAAEAEAFAAEYGLKFGDLQPTTFGPNDTTFRPSGRPWPVLAATTDLAKAKDYARFGFAATGVQMLQTDVAFTQAREMCDRLNGFEGKTWNDILVGAGDPGVEKDAVLYGLMTATSASFKTGSSPVFGGGGGGTIASLIAYQYKTSNRKPGDPGASGL